MIFNVLLVSVIPTHVWTYKILMIPVPGKSHIFSFATIAEGLINGGHKVTIFIGENYPLNLPELRNRTELNVVRYKDTTNEVHKMEYDAILENVTKSAIETGGDMMLLASTIWKAYVCLNHEYPYYCLSACFYIYLCHCLVWRIK